jgi:RHS repeat-associated protein
MKDFLSDVLILIVSLVGGSLSLPQNSSPAPFFLQKSEASKRLVIAPTQDASPARKPTLTCQATQMGAPCAQGGVATLGAGTPDADHGMGNPVDRRSGNKYQRETDLPGYMGSALELVRHYNAMDPRQSPLGRGWTWSYDTRLYVRGDNVQMIQADASRISFDCERERCTSSAPMRGVLSREGQSWRWKWPTGRQLIFDHAGRLTQIIFGHNRSLLIQRHHQPGVLYGEIDQVVDDAAGQADAVSGIALPDNLPLNGDALKFVYRQDTGFARVTAVHTRYGVFRYAHDFVEQGKQNLMRLTTVTRPDDMRKLYHYEPQLQSGHAQVLTGISITRDQTLIRTHSWEYDARGRAVAFIPGAPGQGHRRTDIVWTDAQLGLSVTRDPYARIRMIQTDLSGWPGLSMTFDPEGDMTAWQARGVGRESWHKASATLTRRFADQTTWQWDRDHHGRVSAMHATSSDAMPVSTQIALRGLYPAVIDHPEEQQILRYVRNHGLDGLIREREISRPTQEQNGRWRYRERFRYDQDGHRTYHALPEGGALYYRWSGQRLHAIDWEDPGGRRHTVFESIEAGIRHGNGLVTAARMGLSGLQHLMVYQPGLRWPLFHQEIAYGSTPSIFSEQLQVGGARETWRYRYDALGRLSAYRWAIKHPGGQADQGWNVSTTQLRWFATGAAARRQEARDVSGTTEQVSRIERDASGLPTRIADQILHYNAQRRLSEVRQVSDGVNPVRAALRYTHNAFGERIRRDAGDERTHYLFDQHKVVAQASVTGTKIQVRQRYIYAHHVPVAVIEQGRDLYMIHADAMGLPRMVTDDRRRIRWQGQFSPLGALISERGDLSMPLRFPGQIVDQVTGWHENYQRTYDPQWGHYLEPDPLGPVPGNSLYGYADQQPRRHVDPLGLMLFAFDGTGNQPSSLTNVWLFAKAYADGPVHYIPGPAGDADMSPAHSHTDAAIAWSGGARVDQQWERLLNAFATLQDHRRPVPIDIVGFSRGAALARHFGNRVVEHVKEGRFWSHHPMHGVVSTCVDMRFMGLFDTVAQFNVLGAGNAAFNLEVSPAWKWVSHAVALHEHRWLFPLTSAAQSSNVVERAFVGAHADIGGGYLTAQASPGSTPGDLSQVVLAWMQWQADAAGLSLSSRAARERINAPIVHDERAVFSRKIQNGDRRVNRADGTKWVNYQAELPTLGAQVRREVESLIARQPHPALAGPDAVGLVDMSGYAGWLRDSMGFIW